MDDSPYKTVEAQYRETALRREEEDRELLDSAANKYAKLEALKIQKRKQLDDKNKIELSTLLVDEWDKNKEFQLRQQNEREALQQCHLIEYEKYQNKKSDKLVATRERAEKSKQDLETELAEMEDSLKKDIEKCRRIQHCQRESEDAATRENVFNLMKEQTGFMEIEDSPSRSPRGALRASSRASTLQPSSAASTMRQKAKAQSGTKIRGSDATQGEKGKECNIQKSPDARGTPDSQLETPRPRKKLRRSEYIEKKRKSSSPQKNTSNSETSTPPNKLTYDNSNNDNDSLIDPHDGSTSEDAIAFSDAETIIALSPKKSEEQIAFPVLRLHCPDIDPKTNTLRGLSEWRPSDSEPTMHLRLDNNVFRPYTDKYCDDEHPDWVITLGFIWCLSYNPKNAVVSLLRAALEHGPRQWQSRDVWVQFLDAGVMQGFVDYCRGKLGRVNFQLK